MRRTLTMAAVLAAALVLVSVCAAAREPGTGTAPMRVERAECDTASYHSWYHVGAPIPDNDPNGVVMGPIDTPEGSTIEDVILGVELIHSYQGDLRLWLLYDTDCDGLAEVIGELLCRPGMVGCPPDGCCGYEAYYDGWYVFDDAAATSVEEFATGFIPNGCYGPDYDSSGLAVFDGMATGGCFWLWAADGASSDVGSVSVWQLSLLLEETPVVGMSWGSVKGLWR